MDEPAPPPGHPQPVAISEPQASADIARGTHPIRLVVTDDLVRSRLTVFFRALLALPPVFWLTLWGALMFPVAVLLWLLVIILGRAPRPLHRLSAAYVRYAIQVGAYLSLAANPWPGFIASAGYPVDVVIDDPSPQSRLSALFRSLLAFPAFTLAVSLGGFVGAYPYPLTIFYWLTGVVLACAFLGWFAALALGRMPSGLRDLQAYSLGYGAQASAYLLFVTGRYPNSDPNASSPSPRLPAKHPITMHVTDGLERSRLTVLFRLLLVIPHLIWLYLWGILAILAGFVGWIATLVLGRLPLPLHRFIAAWIRYAAHVYAFLFVIGNRFPGFVGAAGSYAVDLEIDPPQRQSRLRTLFRGPLALPAFLVSTMLVYALYAVGIFAWWYALVLGRVPVGLRNLGAACIRYQAQVMSYTFLITERYPYAAPALAGPAPEAVSIEQPLPDPDGDPPSGEVGPQADAV